MNLNTDMTIGSLRVSGAAADNAGVRARVSGVLDQVEIQAGLPPAAILVVRQFDDPLPGEIGGADFPFRVSPEWNRAFGDLLRSMAATAARPITGHIPDSASAVKFSDRAEMLAALAVDLARGDARRKWWWRSSLAGLRHVDTHSAIPRLLEESVEIIPAVIQQLLVMNKASQVVAAIAPREAIRLSTAVAQAFGAEIVATSLNRRATTQIPIDASSPGKETRVGEDTMQRNRAAPSSWSGMNTDDEHRPAATDPWLTAIRRASLEPEQAFLAAFSLALARRPSQVREPLTQRQLLGLLDAVPFRIRRPARDDQSVPAHESVQARRSRMPSPAEREPISEQAAEHDEPERATESIPPGHASTVEDRAGIEFLDPAIATLEATVPDQRQAKKTTAVSDDPTEQMPVVDETTPGISSDEAITTDLGGVLYLVNLFETLGLHGCLEERWHLESGLGPWAMLEVFGRALARALEIDSDDDEIWRALAALDGREPGEPPQHGLPPGAPYRIPPAWLSSTPANHDNLQWASARGWFSVWSRDFVYVDEPRKPIPLRDQLADVRAAYAVERGSLGRTGFADSPTATHVGETDPLERLVTLLVPFLRCRLAVLTGGNSADVADLLRCRAQLFVTRTHVDLVAPLDSISMVARRTGLDRDPGWLPLHGRVLQFHFT